MYVVGSGRGRGRGREERGRRYSMDGRMGVRRCASPRHPPRHPKTNEGCSRGSPGNRKHESIEIYRFDRYYRIVKNFSKYNNNSKIPRSAGIVSLGLIFSFPRRRDAAWRKHIFIWHTSWYISYRTRLRHPAERRHRHIVFPESKKKNKKKKMRALCSRRHGGCRDSLFPSRGSFWYFVFWRHHPPTTLHSGKRIRDSLSVIRYPLSAKSESEAELHFQNDIKKMRNIWTSLKILRLSSSPWIHQTVKQISFYYGAWLFAAKMNRMLWH